MRREEEEDRRAPFDLMMDGYLTSAGDQTDFSWSVSLFKAEKTFQSTITNGQV